MVCWNDGHEEQTKIDKRQKKIIGSTVEYIPWKLEYVGTFEYFNGFCWTRYDFVHVSDKSAKTDNFI